MSHSDTPALPAPSSAHPARRHLAPIWFGSVGLVIAVVSFVAAAWLGFFTLPDAVDEALDPIIAGLDRAAGAASSTATIAARAADEVEAGRDAALGAIAVQVDGLRAVVGQALGAVRTIEAVPGVGALLPEEILPALESADTRLGDVAQTLADPPTDGRVVTAMRSGVDDLEASAEGLEGYSRSLTRFRDAVQTWNVIVTIVVLVLILWIASGQVSLVRSGLHHRREHPEGS